MTLEAIKQEIEALEETERQSLLDWLLDQPLDDAWDRQMARDFAAGQPAAEALCRELDAAIDAGNTLPLRFPKSA